MLGYEGRKKDKEVSFIKPEWIHVRNTEALSICFPPLKKEGREGRREKEGRRKLRKATGKRKGGKEEERREAAKKSDRKKEGKNKKERKIGTEEAIMKYGNGTQKTERLFILHLRIYQLSLHVCI